jgi:hypothetical protein
MRIVTISTELVLSLIGRKDARKKLPPIRAAAVTLKSLTGRGCQSCTRRKNQTKVAVAVRAQMVGWSPKHKAILKALLGADKIRFYTVPSRRGGSPKQVEF